jgi:plasmid replication initiation protein
MKLESVSKKTKIRHKTDINKTFSTMPLSARRVLFLCLAQLDPKKIIPESFMFRIYANEYATICNIDSSTAYSQLKDSTLKLQQHLISIPRDKLLPPIPRLGDRAWKKPEGKGTRVLNVTDFCDYIDGEGYIEISFSRQMEPYICSLSNDYTTQVLLSAVRLRDTNASNFYQLIRKNISQGNKDFFDINVIELKQELGLYTTVKGETVYSYPEFKHFNSLVLKRSIKAIKSPITELTNIDVKIIERKGRKANILRISYTISEHIEQNSSHPANAV